MKLEFAQNRRPRAASRPILGAILCLFALLAWGPRAELAADTAYLKNGTQVHGKVVGQDIRSITLLTSNGVRRIPKSSLRRLTYGPVPDAAAAAREKEAAAAKRREAERQEEALREQRKAEEARREQAAREQQKAEEARRRQAEKEREREQAEANRKEAAQREREKAAFEKKQEDEKRKREALNKKSEEERQEQEAARLKKEEEGKRTQAEADQKKAAEELERRTRIEYSHGTFVLTGGREVPGTATRIEKDRIYVKTTAGVLMLQRGDIEKVRITTKGLGQVVTADKIRAEVETGEKDLELSGRLINRTQVVSIEGHHYVETAKGKIRLSEEEAAAYGLAVAPPTGAEPTVGQFGLARLRGGTDVRGVLVSRDANQIVLRTGHGLILLLATDVAYIRTSAAPAPSFLGRLFGRLGF